MSRIFFCELRTSLGIRFDKGVVLCKVKFGHSGTISGGPIQFGVALVRRVILNHVEEDDLAEFEIVLGQRV